MARMFRESCQQNSDEPRSMSSWSGGCVSCNMGKKWVEDTISAGEYGRWKYIVYTKVYEHGQPTNKLILM